MDNDKDMRPIDGSEATAAPDGSVVVRPVTGDDSADGTAAMAPDPRELGLPTTVTTAARRRRSRTRNSAKPLLTRPARTSAHIRATLRWRKSLEAISSRPRRCATTSD